MPHFSFADNVRSLKNGLASNSAARIADQLAAVSSNDLGAAVDGKILNPHSSGCYTITTAAAETNDLAAPEFVGQLITFICITYAVGDRVITTSAPINQAGNNTITFDAVDCFVALVGTRVSTASEKGTSLEWRVVANDGATLSTVP